MNKFQTYYALVLFFVAGLAEIGGGYLIWHAMRGRMPLWIGIAGGLMIVVYGLLAAMHTEGFSRTYAAYGGVFVIMSVLWGWYVDKIKPDVYDVIGGLTILLGISIMYFVPRK